MTTHQSLRARQNASPQTGMSVAAMCAISLGDTYSMCGKLRSSSSLPGRARRWLGDSGVVAECHGALCACTHMS